MQYILKYMLYAIAFIIGIAFAYYFHPYEQCKRMYTSPEDISECVWILEQ